MEDRAFVEALREFLGLAPLYGEEKHRPYPKLYELTWGSTPSRYLRSEAGQRMLRDPDVDELSNGGDCGAREERRNAARPRPRPSRRGWQSSR